MTIFNHTFCITDNFILEKIDSLQQSETNWEKQLVARIVAATTPIFALIDTLYYLAAFLEHMVKFSFGYAEMDEAWAKKTQFLNLSFSTLIVSFFIGLYEPSLLIKAYREKDFCHIQQQFQGADPEELLSKIKEGIIPTLRTINLSQCTIINEPDLDYISRWCPNLSELNLSQCEISDEAIKVLQEQRPNLQIILEEEN